MVISLSAVLDTCSRKTNRPFAVIILAPIKARHAYPFSLPKISVLFIQLTCALNWKLKMMDTFGEQTAFGCGDMSQSHQRF